MLTFQVCVRRRPREANPVDQTPGFPPLFGIGCDYLMVFVQPLHRLPDGEDLERQILGNEGVHRPMDGLAVVQFGDKGDVISSGHRHKAAELWCRYASLLGWRFWRVPPRGGLPLQEVCDRQIGKAFAHDEVPWLIVARRDDTTISPVLSSPSPTPSEAAA
jgi:hypothetical protein